jgi:DNA-binding MarR family transcriptional regulator
MQLAPIPFDEAHRLDALRRLRILDTETEERFDRITRIAHHLLDVPFVLLTLIDDDRVWFKSVYGCEMKEERRDLSICGHAICNAVTDDISSRLFEVLDTEKDDRFYDNAFVVDTCGIRYHLGFVIQSLDHCNIGTLCVVDKRPRTFTAAQIESFIDLGLMAEAEINGNQYDSGIEISSYISNANSGMIVADAQMGKFLNISTKLELVQKQFNDSLKTTGIKYKEWHILNEIMQREFASPHLMSKKLGIAPSLMTRKLDALEIKRLIERWHSKDGDRRFVHLVCSKKGKKVWQKGVGEINRLSQVYMSNILCL